MTGLALAGAVLWLRARLDRDAHDPVDDPDELEAAEREVRDLDAFSTPDQAAEDLPDWGPGTP